MKNRSHVIYIVLLLSLLTACGKSVSRDVEQAVSDNKTAKSKAEWEQSEAQPERLFEKWNEESKADGSIKKDVCAELANLRPLELTLFEDEFNKDKNKALLEDCKDKLSQSIEDHYADERKKLEVGVNATEIEPSRNNFKFASNIQTRDLSEGYFAVTGDVAKKEVILTFDDGPSGLYTESILRSLREVNAKAIFFHLGKNVRANSHIVKKVAADGHGVASHSMTHACLGPSDACKNANGYLMSFDQAIEEIKEAHQAIYDVLGWVDPFFRFPYGESSRELKAYLARNQTAEFYWSIDSEDWRAQSNQSMIQKTFAQLEARGRGIILFHDIQRKTAESLPQILREIYQRGYSIVLLQAADSGARYNSSLVRRRLP